MFDYKPEPIKVNTAEALRYNRAMEIERQSNETASAERVARIARSIWGDRWYDKLMMIISRKASGLSEPEELRKKDLDDLRGLREVALNAMWDLKQFVEGACEEIQALTDENERLQRELDEARGV